MEEGKEQGKREVTLNAVRQSLAWGFSLEQKIAQGLSLSLEEVRQMAQQSSNEQGNN